MCKESGEIASSISECCYNHYFNGTACSDCEAGFTGLNCSNTCNNGSYGALCSSICNCTTAEVCHHIHGCEPGNDTILWTTKSDLDYSDETENTVYTTTNSKTITSVNTKVNAYKTSKHGTTVISVESSKPTRTNALVSTVTFDSDVPRPDNGTNNNTILVVIGGVIGLFLGILVLQMCVKLMMSRKKKKKRESLRRNSLKVEEETYQEINEAMMGTSRKDDEVGLPRLEKYYELKFLDPDSAGMSYRKLGTEIKRQDIGLNSSSTRSDSTKSSDSYIEPATNTIEGQDYLDVVHTAKEQDKFIVDSQKDGTEEECLGKLHPSSLYLEPVHVTDQPQVGSIASSCSPCGDSKTYLDVIQ